MPISRTVNGLLAEIACDQNVAQPPAEQSPEDWYFWQNLGTAYIADDSSDKKEGVASQQIYGQCPDPSYPGAAAADIENVGMVDGGRIHVWHKSTDSRHTFFLTVWDSAGEWVDLITKVGTESWTMKKVTVPAGTLGGDNYTQALQHRLIFSGAYGSAFTDWIDHLVVSLTQYLTVTGLTPGQKVGVYRASDGGKVDENTCAGGQTQVVLDLDGEEYPEYLYLKVYATDSATLIEVTPNYLMSGGDTYYWICPFGTLHIASSEYTIYRTGSSGSPTSAIITATLRTPAEAPYPSVTVYFTTSKGTVSPTSAVTDSNGQVSTTLTSTLHGIAVVKANWPGDASVPAAVAYATHHVLYDVEVADPSKKFQLFIEGIEYGYANGKYTLSSQSTPQEFSIQISEWVDTITRRGIVSIYRKGVPEFSGVLTVIDRTLSDSPNIALSGTDSKSLLDTRVVTLKDYSAQTISYILNDLLASFWSGVGVGVIGTYPDPITITCADESLGSSVSRLCDDIGWFFRVTTSNKLDVKSSFGVSRPNITFTQGINLFVNQYKIDDRQACNSLRMRGNEDLASTVFDGASIENDDLGLLEGVAFQKSIGDQATLDIAALAQLAKLEGQSIQIQAEIIDSYDAGSWGLDDSVVLNVPEHDLSDSFKVVRIERDMTDPNTAIVDFTNKLTLEWSDVLIQLRRELKDLNAKTTI